MNKTILILSILLLGQSCENISDNKTLETYHGNEITHEKMDAFLSSSLETLEIPAISIAIINQGEIVYSNNIGVSNLVSNEKVGAHSIFEAASLSKSIFAFFVMKLSEKGIIDIDRPLHYYMEDSEMEKEVWYKEVTARMVLNHSTGFTNWRWFDPLPANRDLERGDFFMVGAPGSQFSYSGEAYQYLARVIAHINYINMYELNELFLQEVANPFNIKHAYFVWDDYLYDNKVYGHLEGNPRKRNWGSGLPHQNSKVFNAAGGLHTNAETYATFLSTIMNKRGLYAESFEEMLSPYTSVPADNMSFIKDGITSWGLGFGIQPLGTDTIFRHGGSNTDFQSEYAFSMKKKIGYVFFLNCDKGDEFKKEVEALLDMTES